MRSFAYSAVRKLPSTVGGLIVFVVSTWAAVDAESLKRWFAWKVAHVDLSTTGAVIALIIAGYVAARWVTRDWNSTDRDFYRTELQTIYNNIWEHLQQAIGLTSDEQVAAAQADYQRLLNCARDWIVPNMGQAAWVKFLAADGTAHDYTWPGGHSLEAQNARSVLIENLKGHRRNADELMSKATWDHPIPLRKRRRTRRWQEWRTALWKAITWPRRVLTRS